MLTLLLVSLVPTIPLVVLVPPALVLSVWIASNLATRGLFFLILARTLSDSTALPDSISSALNIALAALAVAVLVLQMLFRQARMGKIALWIVCGITVFSLVGIVRFGLNSELLGDSLRIVSIVSIGALAMSAAIAHGSRKVMNLLLAASVPAAILSVAGWISHSPYLYSSSTGRAFGTFPHPVAAAAFFSILALVALFAFFEYRTRWSLPLLGLFSLAVLGTASLGGLVTLAVGVAVLLLLLPSGTKSKWTAIWVLLLGGGVLLAVAGQSLLERISVLSDTSLLADLDGTGATNSTTWRFRNWLALLDYWHERPFFGWGFGSTSTIIRPLGELPHSGPIRLLVETGALGFALFATLFVVVVAISIRQRVSLSGTSGAFRLALLLAVFANALTSNTLGYIPMLIAVGVAWAAGGPDIRAIEREVPVNVNGERKIRQSLSGARIDASR